MCIYNNDRYLYEIDWWLTKFTMLVVLTTIQCGGTMKELYVRLHQGSDAVLFPLKYDYSKSM